MILKLLNAFMETKQGHVFAKPFVNFQVHTDLREGCGVTRQALVSRALWLGMGFLGF